MYNKEIKINKTLNNGYLFFNDREHPLAHKSDGRVYLHRHLASIYLNRWVTPEEHVHHIDEVRTNNEEDNLLVLTAEEHNTLHKGTSRFLNTCAYCTKEYTAIYTDSKYCSTKCSTSANIKHPEITKELLDSLIPNMTWVALGNRFGYTDNGIKKRAKALGCIVPIRKISGISSTVEQDIANVQTSGQH